MSIFSPNSNIQFSINTFSLMVIVLCSILSVIMSFASVSQSISTEKIHDRNHKKATLDRSVIMLDIEKLQIDVRELKYQKSESK